MGRPPMGWAPAVFTRWVNAIALCNDTGATLDELRESVETLESVAPLWTRVFGQAYPQTPKVQATLALARENLARAREASTGSA